MSTERKLEKGRRHGGRVLVRVPMRGRVRRSELVKRLQEYRDEAERVRASIQAISESFQDPVVRTGIVLADVEATTWLLVVGGELAWHKQRLRELQLLTGDGLPRVPWKERT